MPRHVDDHNRAIRGGRREIARRERAQEARESRLSPY